MRRFLLKTILVLSFGFCSATPAVELAGATLPDEMTVGRDRLTVNGSGLREKFFFKIYVAGLYLPTPDKDPDAILQRDSPRVLLMRFVRDVSRDRLVNAYREGFEANNTPEQLASVRTAIDRFLALLVDVRNDDSIEYRYEPGVGVDIDVAGRHRARFPGRDFADAYLRIFLGPKPPTEALKNGLLGR